MRIVAYTAVWDGDWVSRAHLRNAALSSRIAQQKTRWAPSPFVGKDPAGTAQAWDPVTQRVTTWKDVKNRRPDFTKQLDPANTEASDEETEQYLSELGVPTNLTPPAQRQLAIPPGVQGIDLAHVGDQGQKNIEAVLGLATPEEIDYWRSWYKVAHATAVQLARKHKVDLMTAAAVIAVLSPHELWESNIELADAALGGRWDDVGTLIPSRQKAYSIIHNRDFSAVRGPKVFPFFLSVFDPEQFQQEAVIDTHAAAIWLGDRVGKVPSINDQVRAKMERDYAAAGAKFGLKPQEAQALAWVVWRQIPVRRTGAKTDPLSPKELQRWFSGDDTVTLISARETGAPNSLVKRVQHRSMLDELNAMGVDYRQTRGQWFDPSQGGLRPEPSFIVRGLAFDQALKLARDHNQEAFIFKEPGGAALMYEGYRANETPAVTVPTRGGKPLFGGDALSVGPRAPKGDDDRFVKSRSVSFEIPFDWSDPARSMPWNGVAPVTKDEVQSKYGPKAPPKAPEAPSGEPARSTAAEPDPSPMHREIYAGRVEAGAPRASARTRVVGGNRVGRFVVAAPEEWQLTPDNELYPSTLPEVHEPPRPGSPKAQDIARSGAGVQNILAVLQQATPEEREFWGRWYHHAADNVREMAEYYGLPYDVVAAVVAVLSPGNKWKANLRAADDVLSGAERTNGYPAQIAKARDILATHDTSLVSGPKVTVFYQSLMDPASVEQEMVLDGHAINIWRGEVRPLKELQMPNAAERAQMVADYKAAANAAGLPVQAVQAITWYIWKSAIKHSRHAAPRKPRQRSDTPARAEVGSADKFISQLIMAVEDAGATGVPADAASALASKLRVPEDTAQSWIRNMADAGVFEVDPATGQLFSSGHAPRH